MTRTTTMLLAVLLLFIALIFLVRAAPCPAQGKTAADWKAEEQRCLDQCPEFPRFSGTETDEQYRKRLEQEDAYNDCQRQCVRDYMNRLGANILIKRNDDGSAGYYKRNEGMAPEYPAEP